MGLEDTMDHMLWMGEQAVTVGRVRPAEVLMEHIARVTPRDIRRVARQIFQTDRMHLAIVGSVAESESSRLRALCRIG